MAGLSVLPDRLKRSIFRCSVQCCYQLNLDLLTFINAFGNWLSSSDSTCPTTLRWLAAQATIYQLSAERINNRLHNTTSSTPQKILNDLDRLIRNSILARKKQRKFRGLMQVWLKHS
ncbi:hypothetical protein IGI04_027223 [Brassica rapa subsp. trilocularis]|uniref:Uncharacterized protein n=1 Tax=Brassica rapa subsp. trilocularis TaxID=1813537 RepID=A0ABQ7KYL9_BRACM|nr:hypothetical protein IGI04_027223 [Brassica rapa subsp. trilocularis]